MLGHDVRHELVRLLVNAYVRADASECGSGSQSAHAGADDSDGQFLPGPDHTAAEAEAAPRAASFMVSESTVYTAIHASLVSLVKSGPRPCSSVHNNAAATVS
jgi:hypothetical protein